MTPIFIFLLLVFYSNAYQTCQTPSNQPGQCVLINHCPHLLSTLLQNKTENSKTHIRQSHCGFESTFFPKVCCPLEAIELFEQSGAISHNQHSTMCGLHAPNGPSDPWLASLEYQTTNGEHSFLCGGVLINKRYVLTAAHCIRGPDLPENVTLLNVHLGVNTVDSSNPPLSVPVDGSTVHEDYDPDDHNQYNDIALVRLKKKISFKQESVRPICLPMGLRTGFVGKKLSVTGWEKSGNFSVKRDGVATVWNNSECHLRYNMARVKLGDSQMCAGGRKLFYRDSHRFDFWDVLMHVSRDTSYYAVGIMSVRPPCCQNENYPKVYTKVANYIDWIMSNLKP